MPKNKNGEFGTPQKVFDVTKSLQDVENRRAEDRAKINSLFNGSRPYTSEEEKKFQIQINVNWGIGPRIMSDANRQMNNALLHPGTLFTCNLEKGKPDKRDEWSAVFTKNIHKPMQRGKTGKRHHFIIRSRNANVCMHGIGALLWPNANRWMPRYVPLEDLLVPTDTYCDFSNLRYFAVNLYLTPGELADMALSSKVDPGWNQKMVKKILDDHRKNRDMPESGNSTWREQPEAMMEIQKQNKGYYYSDAIPKVKLRAFYYQEIPENPEDVGKWHRHVILRESAEHADVDEFVYDGSSKLFAEELDHILNVQYGDSSLVAPLKYHSVRGLGVPLFAPVETLNRLQCEFVQHVLEQLKMYFKITDPADRDRVKNVVLQAYGFIPEGLQIVPKTERHQVDGNLVQAAMEQMRQIMNENSSSFVQNADSTSKEMTAFEARARLQQVNVMVSSMLQMMYVQEAYYYEEVTRRFCRKGSKDPQVIEFQRQCREDGIPDDMMVASYWRVVPEKVLGGGDKTLAQVQAQWLLEHKQLYDPVSQQKILREATSTMLDDPAKGYLYVPEQQAQETQGSMQAENVFGTLMQGVQLKGIRRGIDIPGYVETMLLLAGQVIQRIANTDNTGSIEDIIGLQNVAMNVGQYVAVLSQDDKEKERVKGYSDLLGQMMNTIKGFAQRLAEKQGQSGEQFDAEAAAKAQSTVMLANIKAQNADRMAQMKERHKEIAFRMEQARDHMRAIGEMDKGAQQHRQELFMKDMLGAADSMRELRMLAYKEAELKNKIEAEREKARIEIQKAKQKPVDSGE